MSVYVYQDEVSPPKKKLKNFDFDWGGKSVLELGANVGKLGLLVLEQGVKKYKGVEIDKSMVDIGIKRYGLDLVSMDVSEFQDFDYDVTISMALFHHFKDDKLTDLLSRVKSPELIFEVPIGNNDVGIYQTRTKRAYELLVEKHYGEVVSITKSGATNDPYNDRVIFYCKKST